MSRPLHVAVALEGAGFHPAAWRTPEARATELFKAGYWLDLVQEAEKGLLDLVTFEDSFGLQSTLDDGADQRTDLVRGRLDAVLLAATTAPGTQHIGLLPTVIATHTEPFHISKAIASLDYASLGRAGYLARIAPTRTDARLVGRRELPTYDSAKPKLEVVDDLYAEAADHVEVVRRLWDSWEDDAEIRDVATGRFVDRNKLHYIDFAGRWFRVKGPSITPRPPQGQPVIATLGHDLSSYQLALQSADLLMTSPVDTDDAHARVATVRDLGGQDLRIFGDLTVFLDTTTAAAIERKDRLDAMLSEPVPVDDSAVFVGTPQDLAALLLRWRSAGLDGVRLRPAALPHDLIAITRGLTPALQAEGAFRRSYEAGSLRSRFGLSRPTNRYTTGAFDDQH